MEAIFFHDEDKVYGCFSNWYPCSFTVDGIAYASAEQYMMRSKAILFGDAETAEKIMATDDVAEIKALGRAAHGFDQATWRAVRASVVERGVLEKFLQNPDLAGVLLSTGDAVLAEAAAGDRVWGIGLGMQSSEKEDISRWRGENLLGQCLMNVRCALRTMSGYGCGIGEEGHSE
ncbi:MAG: NADAR family protein [Atopobiaceae bacterium]